MGLCVMSITEMDHCRKMENMSADSCLSVLDDQENGLVERESVIVIKDDKEKNVRFSLYSASSESSIGKNSDEGLENVNEEEEEEEVQSRFNQGKDGAFDCLQALDEALPRRSDFFLCVFLLHLVWLIWYHQICMYILVLVF